MYRDTFTTGEDSSLRKHIWVRKIAEFGRINEQGLEECREEGGVKESWKSHWEEGD